MSVKKTTKTITKTFYNLELSEEAYNAITEIIKNDKSLWVYADEFGIENIEDELFDEDMEFEDSLVIREKDRTYLILLGKSTKGDAFKPVSLYYWFTQLDENDDDIDLKSANSVLRVNAYSSVAISKCFEEFIKTNKAIQCSSFYYDNEGNKLPENSKSIECLWDLEDKSGYINKEQITIPMTMRTIKLFVLFIKHHKRKIL